MGWAGHPTEHVLGHRTWDPKSLHTMHHHATHISSVTPSTSLNTSLMHQNQTSFTSHLGREFRRKNKSNWEVPAGCWKAEPSSISWQILLPMHSSWRLGEEPLGGALKGPLGEPWEPLRTPAGFGAALVVVFDQQWGEGCADLGESIGSFKGKQEHTHRQTGTSWNPGQSRPGLGYDTIDDVLFNMTLQKFVTFDRHGLGLLTC